MRGNKYKVSKDTARQGFAARFRTALGELGCSPNEQARLQRMFGVSGQAVRKWAEGVSMPTPSRMPEVAGILGVRRAWLQDGEEPMRPSLGVKEEGPPFAEGISLTQDEIRLLVRYRELPLDQRSAIDHIIAALCEVKKPG